jgi:FkbM family methyltransferase
LGSHLCERLVNAGEDVLCVDNFFTGSKTNIAHLLNKPNFDLMRHDVTFPLYVEVDQIYNLACPASPVHYQHDPVQTTKTSVHGAMNMLGLAKRLKARILQASTSEVYGDPEVHPQPEFYRYNNFVNDLVSGELHFIKLLKRYDPKLCIDIGANIGSYSSTLLEHTNAVVIAFEPLPRAYDALGKLKTTYPERFIPINQGVGAEVGHLDLHFGSEVSVMASFSQEINEIDYVSRNNTNSISVEVNTLDNFFKDFDPKFSEIDLIKIDTEGFEHEVLVGAANTLVKYRPKFIQIEFNHHQLFRSQSIYSFSKILKIIRCFKSYLITTGW